MHIFYMYTHNLKTIILIEFDKGSESISHWLKQRGILCNKTSKIQKLKKMIW